MSHLVQFSDIDTNMFCTDQASGGSGGSKRVFVKKEGAVMSKIQAWKEDWVIRGVEMWMSDGTSKLFGSRSGNSSSFLLDSGEMLKGLYIQASGETSSGGYYRVGAISFNTNNGRSWEISANNLKNDGRYYYDMPNSGIVCGMFGKSGADVDCLGFAILNPIESARLVDVTYPNLDLQVVANTPIVVSDEKFSNATDVDQSYTVGGSKTVTTVRSWSITTGFEVSVGVSVSGGTPLVAEVDASTTWTVSATVQHSRSETVAEVQSWSWPIICPANTKIRATGTMYQDDIDTDYEANVHIELKNGHDYEYKVKGIYEGLNVRSGSREIEVLGPA